MSIQCNMCGGYDDVRELQNSEEMELQEGTAEFPCCRKCFFSDACNSDPPSTQKEKEAMFLEAPLCN